MGVRLAAPPRMAPKRAPARGPRRMGAAEVYASADDAPPHFRDAAAKVRQRDWMRRPGTTEAGIRWLTEG